MEPKDDDICAVLSDETETRAENEVKDETKPSYEKHHDFTSWPFPLTCSIDFE